jgi:ORF6N domain-containing protein
MPKLTRKIRELTRKSENHLRTMNDKKINMIAVKDDFIKNRIFTIRELQVMVDRDLAELYQVETKVLNQAVKRNSERFPEIFRFQLDDNEKNELVTNCDRFDVLKHSSSNP